MSDMALTWMVPIWRRTKVIPDIGHLTWGYNKAEHLWWQPHFVSIFWRLFLISISLLVYWFGSSHLASRFNSSDMGLLNFNFGSDSYQALSRFHTWSCMLMYIYIYYSSRLDDHVTYMIINIDIYDVSHLDDHVGCLLYIH